MKEEYKPELISFVEPDAVAAEAYRALRTSIQFACIDKELKSLVVTSSRPQEGKTTVVSNLGITIAQTDKRVIIVDADMRNPSLDKVWEVDSNPGLSNLLLEEQDLGLFVKKTPVNNLFLLTSGMSCPNPSELLSSERMKKFILTVKEKFDFIIFDSPPLLPVTDAAVLSRITEGLVLVARSGRTAIEALRRVKTMFRNLKAELLGVVLTDIEIKHEHYYYYDYKYKYAKRDEEEKSKIGLYKP